MLRLKKTSVACPEQYDAYDGDKQVGYLRLRHGHFTVRCPDVDGEIVYMTNPKGDGIFEEDERDRHLRYAVDAIEKWMLVGHPPGPDVRYVIED